jgi:hypothetical protein
MRSDNYINANNGVISHTLVLAALAKSNLHWEMHHAQVYALEVLTFNAPPMTIESEVTEEVAKELFSRPQTNITLMGLPVIIDNERYPKGLVRLMSGDRELMRIEALAVPSAFCNYSDWAAEELSEREKFEKLTF